MCGAPQKYDLTGFMGISYTVAFQTADGGGFSLNNPFLRDGFDYEWISHLNVV